MEILVTHDNADFDALAALVAAGKLYPGARMVLGSGGSSELRAFLALHRDRFPTTAAADIDASAVTRVLLVDVGIVTRSDVLRAWYGASYRQARSMIL